MNQLLGNLLNSNPSSPETTPQTAQCWNQFSGKDVPLPSSINLKYEIDKLIEDIQALRIFD